MDADIQQENGISENRRAENKALAERLGNLRDTQRRNEALRDDSAAKINIDRAAKLIEYRTNQFLFSLATLISISSIGGGVFIKNKLNEQMTSFENAFVDGDVAVIALFGVGIISMIFVAVEGLAILEQYWQLRKERKELQGKGITSIQARMNAFFENEQLFVQVKNKLPSPLDKALAEMAQRNENPIQKFLRGMFTKF